MTNCNYLCPTNAALMVVARVGAWMQTEHATGSRMPPKPSVAHNQWHANARTVHTVSRPRRVVGWGCVGRSQ